MYIAHHSYYFRQMCICQSKIGVKNWTMYQIQANKLNKSIYVIGLNKK